MLVLFPNSKHFLNIFINILDPCLQSKCPYYAKYIRKFDRSVTCICPSCEDEFQPVCDTNGLTHASACYLKKYACEKNQDVKIKMAGTCGATQTFLFDFLVCFLFFDKVMFMLQCKDTRHIMNTISANIMNIIST